MYPNLVGYMDTCMFYEPTIDFYELTHIIY